MNLLSVMHERCGTFSGGMKRSKPYRVTSLIRNHLPVGSHRGPYGGPRGGAVSYERGTPENLPEGAQIYSSPWPISLTGWLLSISLGPQKQRFVRNSEPVTKFRTRALYISNGRFKVPSFIFCTTGAEFPTIHCCGDWSGCPKQMAQAETSS